MIVRRPFIIAIALLLLAGLAGPASARTRNKPYDGFQQLLDDEGRLALSSGDYARAEFMFARLIELDSEDCAALREGGRSALALGHVDWAEHWLARADALQGAEPDPELHFLRGETLSALGRHRDAARLRARAEQEILAAQPSLMTDLWLARIYAQRHDMARAEAVYRTRLPSDTRTAQYADIMLSIVEAHILAADWTGAEELVRELLARQPGHVRARDVLAWVLEARGKLDEELRLRGTLVVETRDAPSGDRTLGYARALERAHDDFAALDHYLGAKSLGQPVATDLVRLKSRLALELAGVVGVHEDPSGSARAFNVGATMPLGPRERLVISASHEIAAGNRLSTGTTSEVSTSSVNATAVVTSRDGLASALGVSFHERGLDAARGPGALLALRTAPGRRLQLMAGTELGMPWRESASTIREGGMVHAAHVELHGAAIKDQLIFSLGGLARQFTLVDSEDTPVQLFASAGVDWVVSPRARRTLRGEIFDDSMLWPTSFASALVLSYRHYELSSDDPFGARMILVERSRSEEVSALLRHVPGSGDQPGAVGLELRGGIGFDSARDIALWRAGAGLLLSTSPRSRFSASYDFAEESGNGLTGQRHSGWVTLHVDL